MVRADLAVKLTYDESDIRVLEKANDILNEISDSISKCGCESHWAERTLEARDIIRDLLEGFVW